MTYESLQGDIAELISSGDLPEVLNEKVEAPVVEEVKEEVEDKKEEQEAPEDQTPTQDEKVEETPEVEDTKQSEEKEEQ
jgi:hypothetical protein